MSETAPVRLISRGEYDLFSQDRVKTQKLARGVIYVLMLQIENNDRRAGRTMVELARVPASSSNSAEGTVDVLFKDDDARSVFQLSGVMKFDQLYLTPTRLQIVQNEMIMKEGYFLTNEEEMQSAMGLYVHSGVGEI